MSHPDWASLRDHYIVVYGDTPRPETEQRIIHAYELHPTQVEKALAAAAVDLEAGTIRSGWAIVAKRCEALTSPPSNPSRSGGATREKAIARAEQWMRNAGCHYPSADEAILHLCESASGDRGVTLHAYAQAELVNDGPRTPARIQTAGDQQLIERIRALYEQERPRGLKVEADAEARALKSRQQRAKEPPRTKSTSPSSAKTSPPKAKEHQPTTSSPSSTPSKPHKPAPSTTAPTPKPPDSAKPSPASSPNLENTPL